MTKRVRSQLSELIQKYCKAYKEVTGKFLCDFCEGCPFFLFWDAVGEYLKNKVPMYQTITKHWRRAIPQEEAMKIMIDTVLNKIPIDVAREVLDNLKHLDIYKRSKK